MTRILLTGIHGQVGWELQRTLQPLGEVVALDRGGLDLENPEQLRDVVRDHQPAIIVNPAAYTAVDKAENEVERALAINGTAPGILGEEARRLDALLVHYSTDYVFAGTKDGAYLETDPVAPCNSYGRSKLAGEQAILASGCRHLILRTSWVYGLRGTNFLRTMLRLAAARDELAIVDDQVGAPTWSRMIAELTAIMLARHQGQQGIYHLAAAGHTSWHDFATAIFDIGQTCGMLAKKPLVRRIASADYPTPAERPKNSRLCCDKLRGDFSLNLPGWDEQLRLCLNQ